MTQVSGALCIACGILVAAAWLNPDLFLLPWLGFSVFLFVINQKAWKDSVWHGMIFGYAVILAGFWWAAEPIEFSIGSSAVVAYGLFAIFATFEAAKFATFAGLSNWLIGSSYKLLVVYPITWVALEFIWPQILPWRLGHSQIRWLSIIQIAEFGGVFIVSFLVVAGAVAISQLALVAYHSLGAIRADSDEQKTFKYMQCVTFGALPLLAVWMGLDAVAAKHVSSGEKSFRVGLIQVDPSYSDNREKFAELTREIETEVDLVCWPESSIGTYSTELTDFRNEDRLYANSREPNLGLRPLDHPRGYLLASGKSYQPNAADEGPYRVTAYLIDPNENIVGRYDKRCLIPIGEKVPFENEFPFLRKWANLDDTTEPGSQPTLLEMRDDVRIGALICYEDILPGSARELSKSGANLLICLINGTAFEQPIALRQHQQLAVFRAIENNRFLVRCASTGITSIISPAGEILQELEPQTEGTLIANVSLLDRQTFYTRHGDWFAGMCLFSVLGFVAWKTVRTNEARPKPTDNDRQSIRKTVRRNEHFETEDEFDLSLCRNASESELTCGNPRRNLKTTNGLLFEGTEQ